MRPAIPPLCLSPLPASSREITDRVGSTSPRWPNNISSLLHFHLQLNVGLVYHAELRLQEPRDRPSALAAQPLPISLQFPLAQTRAFACSTFPGTRKKRFTGFPARRPNPTLPSSSSQPGKDQVQGRHHIHSGHGCTARTHRHVIASGRRSCTFHLVVEAKLET